MPSPKTYGVVPRHLSEIWCCQITGHHLKKKESLFLFVKRLPFSLRMCHPFFPSGTSGSFCKFKFSFFFFLIQFKFFKFIYSFPTMVHTSLWCICHRIEAVLGIFCDYPIMEVSLLIYCVLLYSMCDLKAAQMNVKQSNSETHAQQVWTGL